MNLASAYGRSWGYGTVEAAIKNALERCKKGEKKYDNIRECRLHSIGNIKVVSMTKEEIERAITLYKSNVNATNEDLAKPDLALLKLPDVEFSELRISDTRRNVGTYEGHPKWRPGSDKRSLMIGEESIAFFFITLLNISPGESYSWHWKFYTPESELYWDSKNGTSLITTPSWNFYHTLHLDSPLVQAGLWKVEFEFDERVVEERTFEILETGG